MKENLLSFQIGWICLLSGRKGRDSFLAENEKQALEKIVSWNEQQEGCWNFWLEEKR